MAACDKAKRKAGISPGSRLFSVVEDTKAFSTYVDFDSESIDFAGVVVLV